MDEEKKKGKSITGEIMSQGGGAVTGAAIGWTAGSIVALAAAPFTFGLSVLIPPIAAVAVGVYGHKKSQDLD
jgi:hypothetical protein